MRVLLITALMTLLAACAAPAPKTSGFLTSYDGFRPGPEGGVDLVWTAPEIRSRQDFSALMAGYDRIIIDPIWVTGAADSGPFEGVRPDELKTLSDLLYGKLEQAVTGRFELAYRPAPRTFRLSVALVGVERPNRLLATTSSVLPFGLAISTLSKLTTDEHTNVGAATIEVIATDSETNHTLFAAVDRRAGNKDIATITDPLDDAKDAFNWWAERLSRTVR